MRTSKSSLANLLSSMDTLRDNRDSRDTKFTQSLNIKEVISLTQACNRVDPKFVTTYCRDELGKLREAIGAILDN
jgi:hypothetical protein